MTWPLRRMDELVHFLNAKRVPVKSADRANMQGQYPYYGASGIVDRVNDYIFDGDFLLVSEDGENLRSRKSPIAFMARGKYWVNNHAHILDEKEPGILRYLSWVLNRTDLSAYITGAAQPKLNKRTLQTVEIPVPPKNERLGINATLGALDDKIELNRKTATTMEEMARALYRSWFVDFDPVHAKAAGRAPAHMDAATAALFPESFGEDGLPVGWERSTVFAVCEHVKQTVKPTDQPDQLFHHFSLPAFDVGRSPVLENGKEIKSNKLFVPNNAVLFSRLNPSIPRVWWAQTNEEKAIPAASTEFYVAKALHELQTPWLYCLMSSAKFRDEALFRVTGTSNSHQRVPPKAFAEIEVIKPTDDLLQAFGEVCGNWFERIHAMSVENQTLAALRDTLLPRLMSGELRVGEAKEQMEAAI